MNGIEMLLPETGESAIRPHSTAAVKATLKPGFTGLVYGKHNPDTGFHYVWPEADPYAQDACVGLVLDHAPTERDRDAATLPLLGWFDDDRPRFMERVNGRWIDLTTQPYAPEALYSRNAGLVRQDALRAKRVVIVGCGSVGSEMAAMLCRAGIVHFTLIDRDVVEYHNLGRTFDRTMLGKFKTRALAERLLAINEFASVTTFESRLEELSDAEFFASLVSGSTLVISAADSRAADAYCNDLCRFYGADFMSAGFWPSAAVAEVFVYRAGTDDHTVGCVFEKLVEEDARAVHLQHYEVQDGVERAVMPGLGVSVMAGNALASQLALDMLLREEPGYLQRILPYMPSQYLLFSNTHLAEIGGPDVAALFRKPLQTICPKLTPSAQCRCLPSGGDRRTVQEEAM